MQRMHGVYAQAIALTAATRLPLPTSPCKPERGLEVDTISLLSALPMFRLPVGQTYLPVDNLGITYPQVTDLPDKPLLFSDTLSIKRASVRIGTLTSATSQ
jgi:hypothetical protein